MTRLKSEKMQTQLFVCKKSQVFSNFLLQNLTSSIFFHFLLHFTNLNVHKKGGEEKGDRDN